MIHFYGHIIYVEIRTVKVMVDNKSWLLLEGMLSVTRLSGFTAQTASRVVQTSEVMETRTCLDTSDELLFTSH